MKHLTTLLAILMCGSLLAQSEYCGVGTVWDAESQTCIVAENVELLDSNLDGVVGVEDLLNLLSHFGDEDMDFDGIYDSVDDCVGAYDECGVCNGPGPQILGIDTIIVYYDSLYAEAIDEWWVFEVDADTLLGYFCENPGCMDPTADNYDPYAIEEDGSCIFNGASSICDYQTALYYNEEIYSLIPIGNQCWFAENLRTEQYTNGDSIVFVDSNEEWDDAGNYFSPYGAQAIANNDVNNLGWFGRLYNWHAVEDERGLCPTGWHVPSDQEWFTLELELGMDESAANTVGWRGTSEGEQMKSSEIDIPAWNGTNTSGFSALPGGFRFVPGFIGFGNNGYFWSNSEVVGFDQAWTRELGSGSSQVKRIGGDKSLGMSIRCLKD